MTYNTTKNTSHWTDKHTKFQLKNGINHVASTLWKWMLNLGKEGTEIELCLKEFQKYVAKEKGKPFTFWWVKKQFQLLASLRIIHIDKAFGSNWYRIRLRHPSALEPKKAVSKNLNNSTKTCEKRPSNVGKPEAGLYSSSNYSSINSEEIKRRYEVLKLCGEHGIYYDPFKATTEQLYQYEMEDIKSALNHFNKRGGHRKIRDPQAWLVDCLSNAYWVDKSFGVDDFLKAMSEMFSNIPVP